MAGYKDSKEEIKAAEVRELISKANKLGKKIELKWKKDEDFEELAIEYYRLKGKADVLSLELADYLRQNYPNNFLVHNIKLTDKQINNITDLDTLNLINKLLPIHDIGFLIDESNTESYILFNNNGAPVYEYISPNIRLGEGFYEFMEEMGLTLEAVNKLYSIKIIGIPELWPNKVTKSNKLI